MKTRSIILLLLAFSPVARGQSMAEWQALLSSNPALLAAQHMENAADYAVAGAGIPTDPMVNMGVGVMPMSPDGLQLMPRINIMQTLPWPGTLPLQKSIAGTEAALAGYYRQQQAADLRRQMQEALLGWLWQQERQYRLQQQSEVLQQWEMWQQQQLAAGRGNLRDVLSIQRQRLETENNRIQATITQQSHSVSINRLAGRPAAEEVAVSDTLVFPTLPAAEQQGVLLQAAPWQQKETLAQYRSELAVRNGRPMLGVGLEYMFLTNPREVFPAIAGRHVVLPMVSLSVPVYRKRVASAINQQEQIAAASRQYLLDKYQQVEAFLLQAEQQWQQAYHNYETAGDQLTLLEQQIRLVEQALATGESSRGEWLQLQLEWNNIQLMKTEAVYTAHLAITAIQWINTTIQP